MLTATANGTNAPPRAVMMTVAELARRDGVSKPTVSIHIKRLVERHGLTVERDGQGRVARVNVAEYDHLRERVADPSKAQAPRQVPDPTPASESYDEAIRQKTWHEAERRRIELARIKGELVPVADVQRLVAECGAAIAEILDRLPSETDSLSVVVARDGSHGLRVALKQLAVTYRERIANKLDEVAKPPEPAKPDEEAATDL